MTKRKTANPFQGIWMIQHMDQWDVEEEVEGFKPFIEFEDGNVGQFQFGYVVGQIDYRLTQRDGHLAVEFTWDGNDDLDHVFGRGWAAIKDDAIIGEIFFHQGDESEFKALKQRK
jgi:hypothetical protein